MEDDKLQSSADSFQLRQFEIGEHIDCLDTVNHWIDAEVVAQKNNEIKVHYPGWAKKFDEWIPTNSHRILKQWCRGDQIQPNNRLDIRHVQSDKWFEARVIQIDEDDQNKILIHFNGYHSKFDEWVDLRDQTRVAEVGYFSNAHGNSKIKRKQQTQQYQDFLIDLQNREKQFGLVLELRNLVIKEMGTDGNCLFRSVSDQIYGNENYHEEIRKVCMDYIELEQEFFQDYVIGGSEGFQYYLHRKRIDGEWGDDLEIQALSEIYDRPIEIYAYSVTPLRTFHESNHSGKQPIRLSYHGKSHYNSIKPRGAENVGLDQNYQFGYIENIVLDNARARRVAQQAHQQQQAQIQAQSQNSQEQGSTYQPPLNTQQNIKLIVEALKESRKDFEQIGKRDMEQALEESLNNVNDKNITEAIKESINEYEQQQDENLIVQQIIQESKKDTPITEDIDQVLKQSKEQYDQQLLKEANQNETINRLVNMGLPFSVVVEAFSIFGDDPDAIFNYCMGEFQ